MRLRPPRTVAFISTGKRVAFTPRVPLWSDLARLLKVKLCRLESSALQRIRNTVDLLYDANAVDVTRGLTAAGEHMMHICSQIRAV